MIRYFSLCSLHVFTLPYGIYLNSLQHCSALYLLYEVNVYFISLRCKSAGTSFRGRTFYASLNASYRSRKRSNYDGQLTTQRRRKRVIRSTNICSFDIDKSSLYTPLCFKRSSIIIYIFYVNIFLSLRSPIYIQNYSQTQRMVICTNIQNTYIKK